MNHVHHVHLFAADIEKSLAFYKEAFGGRVVLDENMAGARNVFMRIGTGRIHFYDQAPPSASRGGIHHFGIQTDNIGETVARLKAMGVPFKKNITNAGGWKYIMVAAPDNVLIELFEVDKNSIPQKMRDYFD